MNRYTVIFCDLENLEEVSIDNIIATNKVEAMEIAQLTLDLFGCSAEVRTAVLTTKNVVI